MKILQVMAGGKHGGAETAFVDMCIALHEAGQIVAVITRANSIRVSRLEEAGIKTYCLPFGGRFDFWTKLAISRIIKDFQPDIVQSWMARAPWKIPAWHEKMKVPRYLHVSRLGGYYKLKYFKTSDYFVTITPDIREYLIRENIPADHVRHINNFAETEEMMKPLNREDYGVPAGAPLVLGLGRLHVSKAFDVLIRAVAPLHDTYLWIAGEGPERVNLEKLIANLNLQDRVRLLGWRNDRAVLLQASDICAFISRYEPFGTVFVQAWAQKTPVLVSKADGPRQFVRPEEDGLMVEIDDEQGMRDAIARLSNDGVLRDKLVKNGYDRYRAEFTKEKAVEAYLQYYREIRAQEGLSN